MTGTGNDKLDRLKEYLTGLGSVAVAFSGGVDSTFLLKVAKEVLGDAAVAVTVQAAVFPKSELEEAEALCKGQGIRQITVPVDVLSLEGFAGNPPERCYICKRALLGSVVKEADRLGLAHVAEGSNLDDLDDYRPGMRAVRELGIVSPLRQAELTKAEIRKLSRELGLATWQKPAYACLASRFAYGEAITGERLLMVERAERLLMDMGLKQVRVRIHGSMARLEVLPDSFSFFAEEEKRVQITEALRGLGFSYVSLDLTGYRTGSMNETLSQREKGKTG